MSDKLHTILDHLLEKHKNNDYVYARLVTYMENLLPVALDNATELHKQRKERQIQLSTNRDEFTMRFLDKNNYFYSQQTELFLHYDGLHFVLRSEDEIQHQIFSTISSEKCLREWKYKVNKNIIKRIKERSPLSAIPESETIQYAINTLYPSIFSTRNQAKYFLTIIGECIASKKHNTTAAYSSEAEVSTLTLNGVEGALTLNGVEGALTLNGVEGAFTHDGGSGQAGLPLYIVPTSLKEIMREIGNQCYAFFGLPNIFANIKYKYYDHTYSNCRLISCEKTAGKKKINVPPALTKHMLDFLCVAAHYFIRYGSADQFLHQCNDTSLAEHALLLSKNTPESIVNTFIEKSLTVGTSLVIEEKKMIFIWKKFLNERGIPNIIFYENLKTILKTKLTYDETNECFLGVTSIHIPTVSLFLRFWEETICNEHDENLSLDETCALFKSWTSNGKSLNINDAFILELIHHFYPEIVIENNKHILHIKCSMWDKNAEVTNAFNLFRKQSVSANTLYDAYNFYSHQKKNKYNLLVNKSYFEEVVLDIIFNEMETVLP